MTFDSSITKEETSNLQFLQYFRHTLHVLDAHRHKWQAEYVLNETHLVKHRLYTGWISVDEEQREQVGETVMNLAGRVVLTKHLQTYHLRKLLGQRVADD